MFTGIVTAVGRIVGVAPLGAEPAHGKRVEVQAPAGWLDDVQPGDSIAVDGACMTVASLDPAAATFRFDVSAESLAKTTGLDRPGPVNLEKALRAGDRLGGHLVSGHVDGVGIVTRSAPVGESRELCIAADAQLARFLAYKGSLAVNGASLTVNSVRDGEGRCEVSINLVPHTLTHTTLGALGEGDRVNLEVDLIARYVERMLGAGRFL